MQNNPLNTAANLVGNALHTSGNMGGNALNTSGGLAGNTLNTSGNMLNQPGYGGNTLNTSGSMLNQPVGYGGNALNTSTGMMNQQPLGYGSNVLGTSTTGLSGLPSVGTSYPTGQYSQPMTSTIAPMGTMGAMGTAPSKKEVKYPEFQLRVVEARGLASADVTSASDPYVLVKLKGLAHILRPEKQVSGVVWNNNSPVWNQDFVLHPTKTNDVVSIQVLDRDKFGKSTFLGKAQVVVSHYLNRGVTELWVPLRAKRGLGRVSGELHLVINYFSHQTPYFNPPMSSQMGAIPNFGQNLHREYVSTPLATSTVMGTSTPVGDYSKVHSVEQSITTPTGTTHIENYEHIESHPRHNLTKSMESGLGTNVGGSTIAQQPLSSGTYNEQNPI